MLVVCLEAWECASDGVDISGKSAFKRCCGSVEEVVPSKLCALRKGVEGWIETDFARRMGTE